MTTPQTDKEFAHVHLPTGQGVPADEDGYARYVREKVQEALESTAPPVPHEQVMAEAWGDIERWIKKRA